MKEKSQIYHSNKKSIMTIFFNSTWQFCIMVEKLTSEGLTYSEYDFDFGPKPRVKCSSASQIEFSEKKHTTFRSFVNRMNSMISLRYKVVFSQSIDAKKIDNLIKGCNKTFKENELTFIDTVMDIFQKKALQNNIPLFSPYHLKSGFIWTLELYIDTVSLLLIQAKRQKNNNFYTIPTECVEIIWFYAMHGCLNISMFHDTQIRLKKISAHCFLEKYKKETVSSWKFWKNSPSLITTLKNAADNNPDEFKKAVTALNDERTTDLLKKYHLAF